MPYAIELSQECSTHIIDRACQARQQVVVLPKPRGVSDRIKARLVGGESETLLLAAPRLAQQVVGTLPRATCLVDLQVDVEQYFFDTHILCVRQPDEQLSLTVSRPETILVRQRRRFARTVLAEPSVVHLSRREYGKHWTCCGRLYNLSPGGLALKLGRDAAVRVEVGQTWSTCFEVPEQQQVYTLQGVVCRMLPSSSERDVIAAIRFVPADDQDGQCRKLQEFLRCRQRAGARVGGPT